MQQRNDQERIEALEAQNVEILRIVNDIRSELTRYKGFLGGVVFVVGALITILDLFKDYLFKH